MNTERIDQTVRICFLLGIHRVSFDAAIQFDTPDDVCLVFWDRLDDHLEFAFTIDGLDQAYYNGQALALSLITVDYR